MHEKPSKTRAIRYLLCLSIICFSFAGCGGGEPEEGSASQSTASIDNPGRNYTTQKVVTQKIVNEVRAVGTVQAYQEVQVSPEISGKIEKIYCNVGDRVTQGDLLVKIDDESRQIALRQKKALLKKAEATREKTLKDAQKGGALFKEGVISDSESDDIQLDKHIADAELDLARADVAKAEKELRDTKITAPFDGKVALKDVEIGKIVTPGENLLTLVDITRVKILVTISEMDITRLSVGSTGEVMLDSLPGFNFSGRVENIGLKADDNTRTFPVEIVVLNGEEKILPGMVARVIITSKESQKILMIPKKAVKTVQGEAVVYVMNQEEVVQKMISLGKETGEQVIVEKGLVEGDMLIVSEQINPGDELN